MEDAFRSLPSVDSLLADNRLAEQAGGISRDILVDMVRREIAAQRAVVTAGRQPGNADTMVANIAANTRALTEIGLGPVINATGIIIHTNLGRAPLSPEAISAMDAASRAYTPLEFNLVTGARGSRHDHLEDILCQLSGAEAAMVVNNNASAVMLGLAAIARRKEVIVSRGQAVEIGGSFRIPDVMRQSGTKLVEVGTTNCTYATDYENAITPRTAAIMLIHSSNFKIVGFTHEVTAEEFAKTSKKHGLPVLDDLGSGCFLNTVDYGLAPEPMVQNSPGISGGLVFFSGDKLVGGPQAGIILGQKQYIDKLKKHPLARAVRIDKTRLAGLGATLTHYIRGEATSKIPVWRMISARPEDIKARADRFVAVLGVTASVISGESMVGGGSLPGATLPTYLVAISSKAGSGSNQAGKLAKKLRLIPRTVIGRVDGDVLLIDPRTVLPEEDSALMQALGAVVSK
ncbi:L-seryl-tRNA(Sec) selenium transferase [Chloroflexota bacterium]